MQTVQLRFPEVRSSTTSDDVEGLPHRAETLYGAPRVAPWAVGGALAEATAAQLGFAFDPELSPFCGRKGRHLLAVVDGRVNEAVIGLLAGLLQERQTMIICGTSLDPDARAMLPAGCILKKIPASILDQYRRGYLRRRFAELGLPTASAEAP
jgi:hypothetical protein